MQDPKKKKKNVEILQLFYIFCIEQPRIHTLESDWIAFMTHTYT